MQLPPQRLHRFLANRNIPGLNDYLRMVLKPTHYKWYLDYVQQRNQNHVEAYRVNLEDLQLSLGYSRKDNAKRLLDNLTENVDYNTTQVPTGGRPRNIVMLTLRGAQKFCLVSGTPTGKETADILLPLLESTVDYSLLSSYMESRHFRENILVNNYSDYPVVYLADVFHYTGEGLMILKKVGHSKNLRRRQDTLSGDMKTACYFTHVFRCIRNYDCEQAVLKDALVTEKLFKISINGHVSTETLLLDAQVSETQLESLVSEKIKEYNIGVNEQDATENVQTDNRTEGRVIIPYKNLRPYKVQQISPEDLARPVAVFESPVHVTREVSGASRARLKIAMTEGIMYMGHRWLAVADDKDPWIVHDLPPIKETRRSTKGLVAKLTKDASVIKEVFISQREAMKEAQLSGPGAISIAISKKSLCHGHRYIMWEDCEEHLKEAYLETSELPEIPEFKGIRVQRIDAMTGEVEDTYPTIEHVLRFFRMSRDTLKRASIEGRIEKGNKWKILYPSAIESD